jgi:hypothetical protein
MVLGYGLDRFRCIIGVLRENFDEGFGEERPFELIGG